LPRVAAVLSAWGMLATDLRYEVVRTHIGDVKTMGAVALRKVFAQMEAEGRKRLGAAYKGPVRIHRAVDMRYGEQIFEIAVPLDGLDLGEPDLMQEAGERFLRREVVGRSHRRHEELYTYSVRDQEVVLVNARVAVVGELPELPREPAVTARTAAAPRTRRRVYSSAWGDWREVPVFDLEA